MQNAALGKMNRAINSINAIRRGRFLKDERSPKRVANKMLLVMRLMIFFLTAFLLKANAKGFSQTVDFSGKNVSIEKTFSAIESQTGFSVFANKSLLKETRKVSVSVKDMPLKAFLDLIMKDQPIGYEIINKTIFIKERIVSNTAAVKNATPIAPTFIDVTGTINNSEGKPLEGASVTVKETRVSTLTNASGQFSIKAEPKHTLIISYVGYQSVEEPINARTIITVSMQESSTVATAVVVTALGIRKQQRALTYNVQEIKGDALTTVNDGSVVSGLTGKIAGATINNSSAGVGSSSRVVLRGTKSINGNNNALYVIDGIPMPNNLRSQAEDIYSGAGQTGDFISNLNPDDIESVSVLSGPAAAALYGSNAANGVIVINTKRGQKNKTDVTVNNATTFSNPLILPKFQNTYGQSSVGSYYSWGEKLVTPSSYKPADFFETGMNSTSSVTLSTGSDKNQTFISFGNVSANGIVPNNKFKRYNFTGRNTSTFLDGKMNLDLSFISSFVNEQNMISQGQYFNPLVAVYLFPPGDDFNRAKAFERHNPSRNLMTQFWPYGDNGFLMQNPYWVTQRDLFQNEKERYLTTLSLRYIIADGVSISGRAKIDNDKTEEEKKFSASTNTLFASENGFYSLNTVNTRQIYGDVLLNINKTWKNDYSLSATAGGSIEDLSLEQSLYGGMLHVTGVANLFTYSNINPQLSQARQSGERRQKQAAFASAQLGFKNYLYLDITGRNDWASTLAGLKKRSFFYPSIGVSGILSDILDIKSNMLSYLKVRASYSEVGNEPGFGRTTLTYPVVNGTPVTGELLRDPNLQPERTKSLEAGINAALFKGALRVDATAYSSRTYNQFFNTTLSATTGNTRAILNGGRVDNKGIEVSARYTGKLLGIGWSSYATYSLNRNKIVELLPSFNNPLTGNIESLRELDVFGTGSYRMTLKEGGTMGDIYVNTLRVDEHGAIYVDPGSQGVIADPNKFVLAGTNNPKFNLSWGNTLSWNGLSLNVLATARVGGVVVSNTQAIMDAFGVSQASADAREAGGAMVNGRPIPAKEYFQVVGAGASGGVASMYVYSATNVRLAEVALGYDIPVKKLVRFIKRANVSIIGRNLLFFYNRAPFDPELTANTQTYFQGIDYFMMPSLRSVGFSVKLNF